MASERLRVARARVYRSIRTVHLERFRDFVPALNIYQNTRYDFDADLLTDQAPAVQMGRTQTLLHLLARPYDSVELNEPLMFDRWFDLFLQIAAIRVRSRRTLICAYCIGFTDPAEELAGRGVPPRLARRMCRLAVGGLVRSMDRLAFGTPGSMRLVGQYSSPRVLRQKARLFTALPSRCDCLVDDTSARTSGQVLFLGNLTGRKGVPEVMAAWELIEGSVADLSLTIIGKGELTEEVQRWCARVSRARLIVDPPRSSIHETLRRTDVLVLPSQRVGPWREQVGLPIVEGLAHGTEVVTTSETGIASWLRDHGHRVVRDGSSPQEIADAIVQAARSRRPPDEILAQLPMRDSRADADAWMHGLADQ